MSVREVPDGAPPLSLLLRNGTGAKHRRAEKSPFVRALLFGRVAPDVYARYVQSLYFVYAELEGALDQHRAHPIVSQLDFQELRRLPRLEEDLAWWCRRAGRAPALPSRATQAYRGRIRAVAESAPILLVGHLYTRYLGDLSGGQAIGRALERAFGLVQGAGVAFYRFGVTECGRLRDSFRARLDQIVLDRASAELVVAEAGSAFEHTERLFEELAPL